MYSILARNAVQRAGAATRGLPVGRGVYRSAPRLLVRPFLFTALPKFLLKATRIPAAVGGGLAGAGTYVAYKVEQASSYAQDQVDGIRGAMGNLYDGGKDAWNHLFGGGGKAGGSASGAPPPDDAGTAVVAATALGVASSDEDGDADADEDEDELLEQEAQEADSEVSEGMMSLTRQMIEIRALLQLIDQSDTLRLPSIVVVGSQLSGKLSVLELIVGQLFLPKGSNMVTRRPIELTLVNTPDAASEVADFPALRMNNISDFDQVRKVLFDLNMAVPAEQAVSDEPIQLTIRSPRVPDLTLVDLPGYIQVEAADQPVELKSKIRAVCDRYLEQPNIILAISAADVDLANSTALRAAKVMDPRGERTIGVITKLDLVLPEQGREILTNKRYPLRMGYVGVVTKPPAKTGGAARLFGGNQLPLQVLSSQLLLEAQFFRANKEHYQGTTVGTRLLRRKLMRVLERLMALLLQPTHLAIQQELEEALYRFKVEFNDRPLTPETYLANNIDALKVLVKEFGERFGRAEIRQLLKAQLDQKVLDLLAERYWNKPSSGSALFAVEPLLDELPQAKLDDVYWHKKVDLAQSSLTKLGVGRLLTTLVTDALLTEIGNLVGKTDLRNHPLAQAQVKEAAALVLKLRYFTTADQVENCIKPFKYEIELEDREWMQLRDHAVALLKEEMRQCDEAFAELKRQVGGRKLALVMTYLQQRDLAVAGGMTPAMDNEALGFLPLLLAHGRDAMFLKDRLLVVKTRLGWLKLLKCKSKDNRVQCPEIFLDAVADKLTQTAILFLNVELLADFYYKFPRELDRRFFGSLTPEQIEFFAKEDPKVKRHIELQQRKELLEEAQTKIEGVMAVQRQVGRKW